MKARFLLLLANGNTTYAHHFFPQNFMHEFIKPTKKNDSEKDGSQFSHKLDFHFIIYLFYFF